MFKTTLLIINSSYRFFNFVFKSESYPTERNFLENLTFLRLEAHFTEINTDNISDFWVCLVKLPHISQSSFLVFFPFFFPAQFFVDNFECP